MNPSTQHPPLSHRAPRRRILRDLLGLLLIGSGTVGMLGALYVAEPRVALFLAGILLPIGGAAVLNVAPRLPRPVRFGAGYCAISTGLTVLAGLAYSLTPWSLLFALVLAVGIFLSSEER